MNKNQRRTILGIDFGEKNIGLAIGNEETGLVIPKDTIKNSGQSELLNFLTNFCQEWEIDVIVIGLPLNMDSKKHKENKIYKEIQSLAKQLDEKINSSTPNNNSAQNQQNISSPTGEKNDKNVIIQNSETEKHQQVEIELLDERLSTFEAKNQIQQFESLHHIPSNLKSQKSNRSTKKHHNDPTRTHKQNHQQRNYNSHLNITPKASKKSKKKRQNQIDSTAAKVIVERWLKIN